MSIIEKNEYMQSLLRYIESNISDELETELLSSVGYVSRGKLYYDFYSLSGHSVKEYVRKRRLSNALALIKASNMGLTDIAVKCGYSSHQALCRSVKQTLGITPSEYKNSGIYYFFPPFKGEPLQSVIISNETVSVMLRVLFYNKRLKGIENLAVSAFMQAFPNYGGRVFGRNGKQEGNNFCYELYLTETEINFDKLIEYGFEISGDYISFSAMFATSVVPNDEYKINAAWDYLYSQWLQNSMFEYTNEPYYEEYIINKGKPAKLKLYLPIRERGEDTKISLVNNPGLCFITTKVKGCNAEEAASQKMIDYLTKNHYKNISAYKELYIQKGINAYACGVKISCDTQFIKEENIGVIKTAESNYLVLESSVTGDYDRYTDILFTFAGDNGMDVDKNELFAVYNIMESSKNPKIQMYCPVKVYTK